MEKRYAAVLTIANLSIYMYSDHKITILKSFKPFLKNYGCTRYDTVFHVISELPQIDGNVVYAYTEYDVYKDKDGKYIWLYKDAVENGKPYAVKKADLENRKIDIWYLKAAEKFFSETGNCFFHVGWESILLHEQRFILHASCVDTPCGGILFVGPSGIGKSTQADLWCRYAEGTLINGDRVILSEEDGCWFGYGSPYAGSSKCYVNKSCPIRAIVILGKSEKCVLHTMRTMDAFKKVFAQITVNHWNEQDVQIACSLAEQIIRDVSVYEYDCTQDIRAIEVLKEELMKGEGRWNQHRLLQNRD